MRDACRISARTEQCGTSELDERQGTLCTVLIPENDPATRVAVLDQHVIGRKRMPDRSSFVSSVSAIGKFLDVLEDRRWHFENEAGGRGGPGFIHGGGS